MTGISFDYIVKELGIKEDLKDLRFKINFTIWFYINFYHKEVEGMALANKTGAHLTEDVAISESNIKRVDSYGSQKSFIKGDSIQKYIDYLELRDTRKSSRTARTFSVISIIIASIAIITPYVVSLVKPEKPKQVIVTENRDKIDNAEILERLTKLDSSINSTITKLSLIADEKVEVSVKKQDKSKSVKH